MKSRSAGHIARSLHTRTSVRSLVFTTAKAEAKRALQVGEFCWRTGGSGECQCHSLLQLSGVLQMPSCKCAAGSRL